ncbi:MAG: DUF5683 domain-containing protein [Chitinophagaceae bacterium]|jgi:hypothetical protein|nr:DUF5683 domain-containing protein [Chitinophagaceae bacterium]
MGTTKNSFLNRLQLSVFYELLHSYGFLYIKLPAIIVVLFCCSKQAQAQDSTQQRHKFQTLLPAKKNDSNIAVIVTDSTVEFVKDTTKLVQPVALTKEDSAKQAKKQFDPNKSTMRSLMIPGWGQIYNHEYWKVPIVWGALAIPVSTFVFYNSEYKKARFAYSAIYSAYMIPVGQQGYSATDTAHMAAEYKNYIYSQPYALNATTIQSPLGAIQKTRNFYRSNRDYSILWFIILWGVQVADATVFGHLKQFDVSSDLSMNITPHYDPVTKVPGLTLVLNFGKK